MSSEYCEHVDPCTCQADNDAELGIAPAPLDAPGAPDAPDAPSPVDPALDAANAQIAALEAQLAANGTVQASYGPDPGPPAPTL